MSFTRRTCLLLAATASCKRSNVKNRGRDETRSKVVSQTSAVAPRWQELRFAPAKGQAFSQHAVLYNEGRKAPLLIALHGAGEARKAPPAGARGWRDDYHLARTVERLKSPPLSAKDFHHFVHDERLRSLNRDLAKRPYRGMHIVCPYTPRLSDRTAAGAAQYGAFLRDRLLSRVRQHLGDRLTPAIGIDGVSMGGRLALLVGLAAPQLFASVGAVQPALALREAKTFCEMVRRARDSNPALRLRLMTSDGDYFREAVTALSNELRRWGVQHDFLLTPGPHDYVYNQGPGGYEMALYHERALRGESTA